MLDLYFSSFNPGVPAAAEITDLPDETKDAEITLKWKEAENNGAPITQYTVYQRTVREDGKTLNWIKIKEVTDTSDRKVVVNLGKGKEYEFVVSATNKFGEGGKEDRKIKKIKVLGGRCILAQAPVVQKVNSAIHRINHYPVDNVSGFPNTYPLDSDLSGG